MTDTGPLPQDDPNGVFPTLDGIPPASPPDVPPGFDLIAILSESMRARPQWRDMAAMASRVIHDYVERTRLALGLSRDPTVLARTLKIATLRMIGLDWTSTLLTDDDYDRVLEAVALFMQEHGPQDFARFMGYALGVPMNLIPLWTADYATFAPGPPMQAGGTVFSTPPGPNYPTAHADLLYELFAPRAAPLAGATAELTDLFYRVAPIHLVLLWIAAQITLSIGTLGFRPGLYQESEDTVVVERDNLVTLYAYAGTYVEEEISVACDPPYPARAVPCNAACIGVEAGIDAQACGTLGAWFLAGYAPAGAGLTVTSGGGYVPCAVPGTGALRPSFQPDPSYVDASGNVGLLMLATRTLYNGDPTRPGGLIAGGCVTTIGPALPDGGIGYTVTGGTAGAACTTVGMPTGTQCVSWAFAPHGAAQARLSRGTQWVGLSVSGGVPTCVADSSTPSGTFGCYALGGGYWLLWAVMTGSQVGACPGYNVAGAVDWLSLQLEDATAPSPNGPSTTDVQPFTRVGTTAAFDPGVLAHAYGLVVLRAHLEFPNLSATYVLLDAQTGQGNRLTAGIVAGAGRLTLAFPGVSQAVGAGTLTNNGSVSLCMQWTPTQVSVTLNGVTSTASVAIAANYARTAILSALDSTSTDSWILSRFLALGAGAPGMLPSGSALAALLS